MKWIYIKDKLPPKNQGVLVSNEKIVTVASLDYLNDEPWYWDGHGFSGSEWSFEFEELFSAGEIIKWKPLPKP